MKKTLYLLILFPLFSISQNNSALYYKKNELRIDALSLLRTSTFGVSYERFIGNRFSTGLTFNYSENQKVNDDFDKGYRNNVPKFECNPYLRYALSKSKSSYYFAEIFTSFNGGDYKEITYLTDENNNGYYTTKKSPYTDYGFGGALGYKMYIHNSVAIEFIVGFGKNLKDRNISPDVISRVGIHLGYRF